ncbi:MAG: hypothetical protein ABWY25_03510, partial [Paenisporosarcina sp.]
IGTIISHVDTYEIMMVENIEITEETAEDPEIVITGRSLECILDQRIVGMNLARGNSTITQYSLNADWTWNHVVYLINDHIGNATYTDDNFVNILAVSEVTGTVGTNEARTFKRESLYKTIQDLMTIDDLGIRTIRRNTFGYGSPNWTLFSIYRGINRANKVIFSWKSGHLEQTEYLWSDKDIKNSALVVGRYVNTVVDTAGVTKFNRRSIVVDANDIDGNLGAAPSGAALTDVINKMQVRGRMAMDNHNRVTIVRSDISNMSTYQYRKDYDIGDLVMLDGNFGTSAVMRVVEYVEIEDENGENGHPTLSVPIDPVLGTLL